MTGERSTGVRARAPGALLLLVPELLPADRGLVPEPALDGGEHRHALLVAARGLRVLRARARTRARAARRGLCGGARRDRDRGRLRAECELAARELLVGALVLEEDDLAVGLAAELEAHCDLRHGRIAWVAAVLVHAARAVRAADADAALADRGEQRVAVAAGEVPRALAGVLEHGAGVVVLVRACDRGYQREQRDGEQPANVRSHDEGLPSPWGRAGRGDRAGA